MERQVILRSCINNMTRLVFANGEVVRTGATEAEIQTAIVAASPSSWIDLDLENIGIVRLNSFIIAYFYEEPAE